MSKLDFWLDRIQRQHPQAIALGLDRVREVAGRLPLSRPAPVVITVGGTNGKGSTVAFVETILAAGGWRVGAYTSPHLLRYNERVRVAGHDASDDALVAAFERVEAARGATPLTYFEHGTLAALDLFARSALDVAILEVGLGGRLDAVNLIDADAAAVTTVDLDHQDWLGTDRDAIGFEKAGIFRSACPAIVGDHDPPRTLLAHAHAVGARLHCAGADFQAQPVDGTTWRWSHRDGTTLDLPRPALAAPCQVDNAATAVALVHSLRDRLPQTPGAVARGVASARIAARLQRFGGEPDLVVDVAHNPQAARALADWLAGEPAARTHAVFAALGDKDIAGIVAPLGAAIAHWHVAGLESDTPRGLSAQCGATRVREGLPAGVVTTHAHVADALEAGRRQAGPRGRVLVFGSFFTAAAALRELNAQASPAREAPTVPV
jgi:dihydrofolate synthase/folylpolyglutamate synthase